MTPIQTCNQIADDVKTCINRFCQNEPAKLRAVMHEKSSCIGHDEGGLERETQEASPLW